MRVWNNVSRIFGLFLFCVAFSLVSCEGPAGPQGTSGKDGVNGVNGTNGKDGTNGKNGTNGVDGQDGNANVKVIYFNPTAAQWIQDSPTFWYVNCANDLFTDEVKGSALIMAYSQTPAGTTKYTFPLPQTTATTTETFFWSNVNPKFLAFGVSALSGTLPSSPGDKAYRIVIAYPSALKSHPNLDWKNYEAVAKTFNLPSSMQ